MSGQEFDSSVSLFLEAFSSSSILHLKKESLLNLIKKCKKIIEIFFVLLKNSKAFFKFNFGYVKTDIVLVFGYLINIPFIFLHFQIVLKIIERNLPHKISIYFFSLKLKKKNIKFRISF